MKTPAEIIASSKPRWGTQSLAEMLRRGITGQKRTPAEIQALEASWRAEEKAAREAHAARQREEWPEHLALCGAPARAVDALRGAPLETAAVHAAREALAARKQSLVLSGWTGAGKTVGACLLFGAARRQETRTGYGLLEWDHGAALFVDFRRLLRVTDMLRFNRLGDMPLADRTLFDDACRVRVLVLDELGGEPGETLSRPHKDRLEELVNCRDAPGRITAYTTNLSLQREGERPSDFSAFVGARVVSRIGRSCVLRDCGTRDLRARP